jgi:hypothetical protein
MISLFSKGISELRNSAFIMRRSSQLMPVSPKQKRLKERWCSMQLNEHDVIGDINGVIQLPLWPDGEPREQRPVEAEDQDGQEETPSPAQDEPLAIQLYLPGFEPE